MKKKLLLMLTLCLLAQWSVAQAPKWVDKAKRAVFSVVTYDQNDKILNTGNGFFVTEDGVALSDYTLFKGAQRAVVMSSDGAQMPVEAIMGADDMYDVVKFRVGISGKKVTALTLAAVAPAAGADVYLLPYSTQKDRSFTAGKVKEADKISGNYSYYTLDMRLKDKMVSCPLMTVDGQVFGLAQKSSGQDTATICYAIDANFAMSQNISALSYGDMSLKGIGIKKALPDTEEQALEVAAKKDDVYYNRAKIIYNYALGKPEKVYKDWSLDKALDEVRKAIAIDELPVYVQLEGDILFAKQDYPSAFTSYDKVNKTILASPATFFSAAKTKELMQAPAEEVLALMDSCVARFTQPYTEEAAPYLLERAQARMNADQARNAMLDYDAYYNAVNGKVNDMFYYYREQAALKAKQYQRALDDMAKAIELNPEDLTYRAELAVVNLRVGRYEEALNVLKAALEKDPKYAEAYRLMGIAQLQMKKDKEACASFAKAKELGDPNVDALIEKHCK